MLLSLGDDVVGLVREVSGRSTVDESYYGTKNTYIDYYRSFPVDLAIAVPLARPPLWIAPWVGTRWVRSATSNAAILVDVGKPPQFTPRSPEMFALDNESICYGVTAGVDLASVGLHRFGAFVGYSNGRRGPTDPNAYLDNEDSYPPRVSLWTLGITYRLGG